MNTKPVKNPGRNPLRVVVRGTAAFALILPLIAMQFTSEVVWDFMDFAVFGTMLLVVCCTYELATRLTGNKAYRLAVGIALLGAFLLTWINLAVGIIGNEENPTKLGRVVDEQQTPVKYRGLLLLSSGDRQVLRSLQTKL